MQKKSVDEIWKELNAKTAPKSRAAGFAGFGIPGVTTKTSILPRDPPALQISAPNTSVQDVALHLDTQKQHRQYDPAEAGVSKEELHTYVSAIQRQINCLTDQDRSARKSAIRTLSAKLLTGDASTPRASPAMLQVRYPLLQDAVTKLARSWSRGVHTLRRVVLLYITCSRTGLASINRIASLTECYVCLATAWLCILPPGCPCRQQERPCSRACMCALLHYISLHFSWGSSLKSCTTLGTIVPLAHFPQPHAGAAPQALLCGPLLHPLAHMCSDTVEACRAGAGQLLAAALPQLADPAPMLPVLLPVLLSRIGHHPVLEEAEEVRLVLVQLIADLVGQLQTR
jgi:hypothetical protein